MSQIQEVKEANNIIEVIGERIKLERSGANYRACCPFHSEKTPSFFVQEQMQRYRCFGCGASGDVIDFVENYESISFYEALKSLADRVGITLKDYQRSSEDEEREKLMEILDLAKEYYHYLLTEHQVGQIARDYLAERGTSAQSIKVFQLGYAMDSWDGLINYLHQKKKFPLDLINKTGLIVQGRNGSYYDRFRGRLIFPLKNHRGQVLGFSGRILTKDAKEAKYINSPETALYHKSKLLFGYSELLQEIKKKEKVIVVEGEFDMISSTQAHVNNIVAIKGSALTQDQVKLLSRVAKTIILCLDADQAGVTATRRAIEIVQEQEVDLRVIDLQHIEVLAGDDWAKDPDEIARENPKLWREAIENNISAYQFLINHSLDKNNVKTPEGQRAVINDLAPVLSKISHAVEKEFYLQQLAKALNVKSSLLASDIAKFGDRGKKKTSSESPTKEKMIVKSYRQRTEEYLLFLLFKFSAEEINVRAKQLAEQNLSLPGTKEILEQVQKIKGNFSLDKLGKLLAEDLKKNLMDLLLLSDYEATSQNIDLELEWQKLLKVLARENLRLEIDQLNKEIEQLDSLAERSAQEEKKLEELLSSIIAKQQAMQKLVK